MILLKYNNITILQNIPILLLQMQTICSDNAASDPSELLKDHYTILCILHYTGNFQGTLDFFFAACFWLIEAVNNAVLLSTLHRFWYRKWLRAPVTAAPEPPGERETFELCYIFPASYKLSRPHWCDYLKLVLFTKSHGALQYAVSYTWYIFNLSLWYIYYLLDYRLAWCIIKHNWNHTGSPFNTNTPI